MFKMKNFYLYINFLIGLLVFFPVHAQQQTFTAKQVVEIFQNELIAVMQQGQSLGFQGRYNRLEIAINQSHDLNKIARTVIGREWLNLSVAQQQQLSSVFSRLSIAAYAHNFKEFSGESFTFDSEEEGLRGGMVIHSYLHIPEDKAVRFDYMLKKKSDHWQIINIAANGVSDLALKRAEYTSILKRDGFDVLIKKITEKINQYAQ